MSSHVPSIKPDDRMASSEADMTVVKNITGSPVPKEEEPETIKLPTTASDREDLRAATTDRGVSPEDKTVVTEGVTETPAGKASPFVSDKDELPPSEDKEPAPATDQEHPVVRIDSESPVASGKMEPISSEALPTTTPDEEHPAIITKEGGADVAESSQTTTDKKYSDVAHDGEAPLVQKESTLVPMDEEYLSITADYKESLPATAYDLPPIPTPTYVESAPVVLEAEPSVATPYRESVPSITVEERPPTITDKETLTATAGEEQPRLTPDEGPGEVETPPGSIPAGTETVVVPQTSPEEVIGGEVSPWQIWHTDPAENIFLAVAIILVAAQAGGEAAKRLGIPKVVGKLVTGMLLGNIYFLSGWDFFNFLRVMPFLKVLADFGALTLLLNVGLNMDPRAMLKAGVSAVLVALGAIIAPAGLGFLVGHFLLPDATLGTKVLLSIILCASSVGIKVKVLEELNALNTLEGRIVIGASFLADVVTLLVFGIACGIITRGSIHVLGVIATMGIIAFFISAIIITSLVYSEGLGEFITRRVPEGLKFSVIAAVCLLLAFLAESIGMHAVIGAFGAGLLFQNVRLRDSDGRQYSIEWIVRPAYMILVPILFVWAGALVRWEIFLDINAVFLGFAVTGVSFLGMFFCSVCPVARGVNRLAVGIAMIPKLEITTILASIGRSIGVLDDAIFSAFIMAAMLTSTVSPPLLKMVLLQQKRHTPRKPLVPLTKERNKKSYHRIEK